MAFHAGEIQGADPTGRATSSVDYSLVRRALIRQFRTGRVARHEVCDAHPELRRAAANYSRATERLCPICEDHDVALVTYAFGPKLPKSGYPVVDRADIDRVLARARSATGYVVEVCAGCGWNHLVRTFAIAAPS